MAVNRQFNAVPAPTKVQGSNPPIMLCPDCSSVMRMLDDRPGRPEKRCWVCPVALQAKALGLLGQPGRRHKVVQIWSLK